MSSSKSLPFSSWMIVRVLPFGGAAAGRLSCGRSALGRLCAFAIPLCFYDSNIQETTQKVKRVLHPFTPLAESRFARNSSLFSCLSLFSCFILIITFCFLSTSQFPPFSAPHVRENAQYLNSRIFQHDYPLHALKSAHLSKISIM